MVDVNKSPAQLLHFVAATDDQRGMLGLCCESQPLATVRSYGHPKRCPPAGQCGGGQAQFFLFVHRHLLVMPYSFSSQFGAQQNPRVREIELRLVIVWLEFDCPRQLLLGIQPVRLFQVIYASSKWA